METEHLKCRSAVAVGTAVTAEAAVASSAAAAAVAEMAAAAAAAAAAAEAAAHRPHLISIISISTSLHQCPTKKNGGWEEEEDEVERREGKEDLPRNTSRDRFSSTFNVVAGARAAVRSSVLSFFR